MCLIKYSDREGLVLVLEKWYPHMLYQINMSNPESILNVDLKCTAPTLPKLYFDKTR